MYLSSIDKPDYQLGRDHYKKCKAEAAFPLANGMQLQIVVRKAMNGGVYASASAVKLDGNFTTHRMFHDFSRKLIQKQQMCNQKNVEQMMREALAMLPTLLAEVEAHYIAKKEWVQAELPIEA